MTSDLVQLRRAPHISRSIDNTALQAYMECPRKYYYSMVRSFRGSGARPALVYGTTWHAIMEAHYKTGGDEAAVQRAAVMSWQPHNNPDDHRTLDRALAAYQAFLARYGSYEEEQKVWGKTVGYPESPIVEQSIEIYWEGALHPYAGKIDRIYEKDGAFYVEDHKTSAQLGAKYFTQFDPSNQMMGYAWLASKLTQLPISGVRINAHGVLKSENKFERQTILFSPERLEEWAINLNHWIRRIDDSMQLLAMPIGRPDEMQYSEWFPDEQTRLLSAFPHQFNACASKYGQCGYDEVCTSPARIRERILETEFEVLPWDPMSGADEASE